MKRLKLFIPLFACLVLGGFFYNFLVTGKDPSAMPSALLDKPVPAFNLPALGQDNEAAQAFLDESIFQGRASLLNIWATWCAACHIEHPFLNRLAEQGVRIVGVSYRDDPGQARTWLEKGGNPYVANVMDFYGRLGVDLGVFGAPETYLVDAGGIIRHRHIGVLNAEVWRRDFAPRFAELNAGEAL